MRSMAFEVIQHGVHENSLLAKTTADDKPNLLRRKKAQRGFLFSLTILQGREVRL